MEEQQKAFELYHSFEASSPSIQNLGDPLLPYRTKNIAITEEFAQENYYYIDGIVRQHLRNKDSHWENQSPSIVSFELVEDVYLQPHLEYRGQDKVPDDAGFMNWFANKS